MAKKDDASGMELALRAGALEVIPPPPVPVVLASLPCLDRKVFEADAIWECAGRREGRQWRDFKSHPSFPQMLDGIAARCRCSREQLVYEEGPRAYMVGEVARHYLAFIDMNF